MPFLVGWANYFARRTQPRGDFETNDTSASADASQHETAITTARPSTATVETGDTSAAADAGHRETAITTAHPSTATVETGDTSATEKHAKTPISHPQRR